MCRSWITVGISLGCLAEDYSDILSLIIFPSLHSLEETLLVEVYCVLKELTSVQKSPAPPIQEAAIRVFYSELIHF